MSKINTFDSSDEIITFQTGQRLTAEDLNKNFIIIEKRLSELQHKYDELLLSYQEMKNKTHCCKS